MSRRTAIKVGVAVVLLASAMAWGMVSTTTWYALWKIRRGTDEAHEAYRLGSDVCEQGPAALPSVYSAIEAHARDRDVANFRVIAADILTCLRRGQRHSTAELPADDTLTRHLMTLLDHEPDPEKRALILHSVHDLDDRAELAMFAAFQHARYPYPAPRAPEIGPQPSEVRRKEWCRVARPILLSQLRDVPDFERNTLVAEIAYAHCEDADLDLAVKYASDRWSEGSAMVVVALARLADTPARYPWTLRPVIATSDCELTLHAVHQLEDQLPRDVADLVTADALACYVRDGCTTDEATCRAELLERLEGKP